jgi:hypothetical protein
MVACEENILPYGQPDTVKVRRPTMERPLVMIEICRDCGREVLGSLVHLGMRCLLCAGGRDEWRIDE